MSAIPDGPQWKELESIIERLHRAFHPSASIEKNVRLLGKLSKTLREIDIVVKQKFGPQEILLIVECKHWKRKIDVKAVEGFAGVVKDVGAHIGIMVSAKGFSQGARNLAERRQINLYTFRDTKREAWPNGLKVPVLLEAWHIKPLALYVKDNTGTSVPIKSDEDVQLHDDKTGEKIKVVSLFRMIWDEHNPKTEGEFCWEYGCGDRREGTLDKRLGVGFSTKLKRTLRQGRMQFQGLVDDKKNEAHMAGFEIRVTEAPVEIEHDTPMFSAENAGFGLLMKTIFVETSNLQGQLLKEAITSGILTVKVEGKGVLAPIRLDGKNTPMPKK